MSATMRDSAVARRVTKRRAETRQRLLDAAFEVFAVEGFGRGTVEQICEGAGYTRGAFYSNFTSLDEMFLAMWEERSDAMLTGVRALLAEVDALSLRTVHDVVTQVLRAIPVDDKWYRITAEFTAHALRNPPLRRVMAAREDAIVATMTPILESLLATVGRTVPDPAALGQAIVAVHDGTTVQCLLEPRNGAVRARRAELFTQVVTAYSTPTGGSA